MDEEDRRTVSADGIAVEKHVDTSRFKTPAVVLELSSSADRDTTMTVTEPIPGEFAIEDIGFHPEFGGEHWSIDGREIVFEREIAPGEEYTTVYGVRDVTEEEIETFLDTRMSLATDRGDETEVDAAGEDLDGVEAASDIEGAGGEEGDPVEDLLEEDEDGAVREVIAGERDSLPGSEAEADTVKTEATAAGTTGGEVATSEEEDAPPEPVADDDEELPERTADDGDDEGPDEKTAAGDERHEEAKSGKGGGYRTLPGSVAEALAAEVRDGTIETEHERVLREAFAEPPEEASGSVDARIEHLQTQVADLSAYTDELERFLDEHGGGDGALADVEGRLAEVAETVDELEAGVDALEAETDDLGSNVADLESGLEETEADVDALEDRAEEAEARLDDAETGIDDLRYLEEDVMELEERTGDLPELEETIEELQEERVDDIDDRLGELSETIDTLESEMEEMKAFRDRLSSAFGPGGQQAEAETE